MNSFNPRRVSYLRPPTMVFETRDSWRLSGYPSLGSIGYPPSVMTTADSRLASAIWHRTFNHVDYAEYKAACDAERSAKPDHNPEISSVGANPTRRGLSRLGAMFTIYPYRDMGWLVTMVFIMAAVSFTLNGVFGILHTVAPRQLDFAGSETASHITFVVGSSLLTLSSWMGLLAAFNVDRAALDPKRDAPDAYKPALLGSDDFVWWAPWHEFKNVFWPATAFRAGVLQLLAGSFFTIAAVGALPGVLDLTHPHAYIIFISSPQLIGGSFFVLAALLQIYLSQNTWYLPLLLDASWQNGFWNLVGASGFLSVGVVTLLSRDAVTIAALSLMTGVGFLAASIIQWYILMEFYPVDPYWVDPFTASEIPSQSIY
ncbi:hypothetical protein CTA2_1782 [Colletotrichum tanaceti]|uniref:Integral membrane protein n=1 Tax=Colletotrichum tanaceti TaxID=1306861 RepID=A0A4U6XHT4_9PEZI|nr:hypothetical protein CTA2_1782 [Colletotrichum tanaceti]TKW55480.1 hypothetical protein CTA1_6896 [Colletotrichum tanaceti]